MPQISWNSSPKRTAAIEKVLPKKPFTQTRITPALMKLLKGPIMAALKAEIKVYRAYPKQGDMDLPSFNPQNGKTCFMGQGFRGNGQGLLESWQDADLSVYRKRIGTLNHEVWGSCTLLEIWAADHFTDHKEMVTAVFEYGAGKRNRMPPITFEINPFFKNPKSGAYQETESDKAEQEEREEIMAKGLVASFKERRTDRSTYVDKAEEDEEDD